MSISNRWLKVTLPVGFVGLALLAGCSSSSNGSGGTPAAGGGAKSASSALKSGQKEGKNLAGNKSKSADKGRSLGGAGKKKNGGAHSAAEAKAAGEKVGSKALGDKSKASDKGVSLSGIRPGQLHLSDEGTEVACDADHEGEGFCGDDAHIDFCSEGHWYALDCTSAEDGAFCGEDLSDETVDCWVDADLVVTEDATDCDEASQGAAFCEDDGHAVFCDGGEWHELSCGDVFDSGVCLEDDASHAVDCAVTGDTIELASRPFGIR
jgi:hypothetical protein